MRGVTDADGRTQRIITDTPSAITEAQLQPKKLVNCCTQHAETAQEDTFLTFPVASVQTNPQEVGSSVIEVKTPEDAARSLTTGEIAIAWLIFQDSIDYAQVKIHNGEYLWFGMQPNNTAMAPDGGMYFNPKRFSEDFSNPENISNQWWFMHEMIHIWQYQLGYSVKWRGVIRIGLSYDYTLAPEKRLSDYNMEAQGNIIADYFLLKFLGLQDQLSEKKYQKDPNALSLLESVLADFLKDPKNKANLP